MSPTQVTALAAAADSIAAQRAELTAKLRQLEDFEEQLLTACENHHVTLETH